MRKADARRIWVPDSRAGWHLWTLSNALEDLHRASKRAEGEAREAREAFGKGFRPDAHAQAYTDLLAAIVKVNTMVEAGAPHSRFIADEDYRAMITGENVYIAYPEFSSETTEDPLATTT